MTAIYHDDRKYRFDNAADVDDLVALVQRDMKAALAVARFSPGAGPWLVPDPENPKGHLKGPDGEYVLDRMTPEGLAGYQRVAAAVDWDALRAEERRRIDEVLFSGPIVDSRGSTGEPWHMERG